MAFVVPRHYIHAGNTTKAGEQERNATLMPDVQHDWAMPGLRQNAKIFYVEDSVSALDAWHSATLSAVGDRRQN
ncbi:hypothetical protein [Herbaspirillum autotrophicum]|uniref:hypothetical protein n=1 Tax=Herbaspirillum autotrophicum TaxID=180195 RepID=UPI00067AF5AF|nr:hypothetical protein [Herbaspirillum autotrophicum]